jgi:hypothetical protein
VEPLQAYCPACKLQVTFIPKGNGKLCPECGAAFDVDNGVRLPATPAPPAHTATTWLVLLAVLLTPPLITFLAALSRNETLSSGLALAGSGVAALFCGIWLAVRLNLQLGLRIGIGILLVPVFYGASFALSFAGCALGTQGGFKVGG